MSERDATVERTLMSYLVPWRQLLLEGDDDAGRETDKVLKDPQIDPNSALLYLLPSLPFLPVMLQKKAQFCC